MMISGSFTAGELGRRRSLERRRRWWEQSEIDSFLLQWGRTYAVTGIAED